MRDEMPLSCNNLKLIRIRPRAEPSILYQISAALLIVSILLGGSTTSGHVEDVILQLLSIPCLLAASWRWTSSSAPPLRLRWAQAKSSDRLDFIVITLFFMLLAMLVVKQLTLLLGAYGVEGIVAKLQAGSGVAAADLPPARSGSLSPTDSATALAGLLPPVAMFCLVVQMDTQQRVRLSGWLTLLGIFCLALGVLQVIHGPSPEATGFFANRNHFAALLYCTLATGVAWFIASGKVTLSRFDGRPQQMIWITAGLGFLVLVLAGLALARSRAGILLAVLMIALIVFTLPRIVQLTSRYQRARSQTWLIGMIVTVPLLVLIGQIGAGRFLERFDKGLTDAMRESVRVLSAQAAWDAFPHGTGLGTFTKVFSVYEPRGMLDGYLFVNRAHNDWIEFLLEAGALGAALVVIFVLWFAAGVVRVWMQYPRIASADRGDRSESFGSGATDVPWQALVLAQFSSFSILLLLAHSWVDYPLRTSAIGVYFSMACGFLTSPSETRRCR